MVKYSGISSCEILPRSFMQPSPKLQRCINAAVIIIFYIFGIVGSVLLSMASHECPVGFQKESCSTEFHDDWYWTDDYDGPKEHHCHHCPRVTYRCSNTTCLQNISCTGLQDDGVPCFGVDIIYNNATAGNVGIALMVIGLFGGTFWLLISVLAHWGLLEGCHPPRDDANLERGYQHPNISGPPNMIVPTQVVRYEIIPHTHLQNDHVALTQCPTFLRCKRRDDRFIALLIASFVSCCVVGVTVQSLLHKECPMGFNNGSCSGYDCRNATCIQQNSCNGMQDDGAPCSGTYSQYTNATANNVATFMMIIGSGGAFVISVSTCFYCACRHTDEAERGDQIPNRPNIFGRSTAAGSTVVPHQETIAPNAAPSPGRSRQQNEEFVAYHEHPIPAQAELVLHSRHQIQHYMALCAQ